MKENKVLELLHNCDSYSYIGDKNTMLYHTAKCPTLPLLNIESIQGCGKKPEASGFFPCRRCLPNLAEEADARRTSLLNLKKSKATVLKDEIRIFCYEYGMYIEFVGNIAYVTTVVGEWYFDPNIRPIKLHHKNQEMRFDNSGYFTGYYHIQELTFPTPAHALSYIYRHERSTIKRLIKEEKDPK